jgi:hypothetical protein
MLHFMKKILCLFILIFTFFVADAQKRPMHSQNMPPPPPPRSMTKEQRERLELFKIQFITKKLDLTPAEAEKFWPLYNEQKEASRNLMQEKKEDEIEFQESMLVIRKKFKKDLMPVLKTEERVNLALKVDRELLNKMRNEMTRRKRPM